MAKFIIRGGGKLNGTVNISGNKNAVFPCLAASLLTKEVVIIKNVPDIADVQTTLEILHSLGVGYSLKNRLLTIRASVIKTHKLPQELMKKLRGSIVLAGPLVSRFGKVKFTFPGGDIVGKRSIETHLKGLTELGFRVKRDDLNYSVSGQLKSRAVVFLDEASVTGTESLILASVIGKGILTFKNCAMEPHVSDLCLMLNKMGAKITGIGSPTLNIRGVKKLHGVDFRLGPDYLEMGTYAIAAALTGGNIKLNNCNPDGLEPVCRALKSMGIHTARKGNGMSITIKNILPVPKLITNIWPGFPTDLMSAFIVLATQARGISLMHDWMYESRMFFVDKLISMGANITIADPHRVLVYGPTRLIGRELETPDIRAGMALVLAALIAKGESIIHKAELIDRGYEDVAGKLSSLGADIKKVD